jgi:hypothetical protein
LTSGNSFLNETLLNGVVADQLRVNRCTAGVNGRRLLKIVLEIRPASGKIAALRAFGADARQLSER